MKCCVSTDVRTWTNWLTFEPDPDYSPDAGTGTLSYAPQRGILLRRENPTYWEPVAGATRGFKMVLFTASRGNNFVGGTCAPPSDLLVLFMQTFDKRLAAYFKRVVNFTVRAGPMCKRAGSGLRYKRSMATRRPCWSLRSDARRKRRVVKDRERRRRRLGHCGDYIRSVYAYYVLPSKWQIVSAIDKNIELLSGVRSVPLNCLSTGFGVSETWHTMSTAV